MISTRIDYGDLPTWVSAVGGLTSLIFAAVAAVAAWRILRTEQQRDDRASEAERRAQAGTVAAWLPDAADREGYDAGPIRVNVRNGSSLPIYRVLISVVVRSDGQSFREIAHSGGPDRTYRELAAPGDNEFLLDVPAARSRRRVALEFRDASGRDWKRDHDGSLIELGGFS
ncbi:hypothetical protein [Cryptosporangium minutisporangium]|uniref:DUF4352 domain-containing protein n=1 Tax=Cryptosporangium minutisporangium TaxID=113569 RepID=A0ABP6SQA2_9ACTN